MCLTHTHTHNTHTQMLGIVFGIVGTILSLVGFIVSLTVDDSYEEPSDAIWGIFAAETIWFCIGLLVSCFGCLCGKSGKMAKDACAMFVDVVLYMTGMIVALIELNDLDSNPNRKCNEGEDAKACIWPGYSTLIFILGFLWDVGNVCFDCKAKSST